MSRKWILAVVLVLVLPVLACSFSLDLGGETPEPTKPPPPTELPTQAPPPPPPTEVPTEAPPPPTPTLPVPAGPSFTNIFFAAGKTDAGDPINVATEFPPGPTIVYAFATWEGMTDGVKAESVWYHEGDEAVRTPFDWSMGSGGATWVAYIERDEGLWSGHYDWELWADDNLLATGSFAVRGEAPVLFQDDFSDPGSGWRTGSFDDGEIRYEGGELHILNYTASEYVTWSTPEQQFTDTVMEVESRLVDGSDDNWHHHMCRRIDTGNYYLIGFSADGYYTASAYLGGERIELVPATRSDAINQGVGATNLARMECVGSRLRLWVNGELLVDTTDSNLTEGEMGLAVASMDGEYSEVAFDNLIVYPPPPRP